MKKIVLACSAIGAFALANPARAAVTVTIPATCTINTATPAVGSANCDYEASGQILSNGAPVQSTLATALLAAGITYTSGTFDNFSATTQGNLNANSNLANLFGTLTGIQVIGLHFGGGQGGGVTDIYTVNFGAGATLSVSNMAQLSSITIFGSPRAVPEPATWAMMLLGFGAIGFTMRRRRNPAIAHLA